MALANHQGVALGEDDIVSWERILQELTPEGRSSMFQDYWQGCSLEMDILGNTVLDLSGRTGIPVPTTSKSKTNKTESSNTVLSE